MALVEQGNVSLGVAIPALAAATLALSATIAVTLPSISASIDVGLDFQLPSITTDLIKNLMSVISALEALLASGITLIPPSLSLSLNAELQLAWGQLQIALDLVARLEIMLREPGIYAYTYTGPDTALGPELSGAIGAGLPGGPECAALVLVATTAGAQAALKALSEITG